MRAGITKELNKDTQVAASKTGADMIIFFKKLQDFDVEACSLPLIDASKHHLEASFWCYDEQSLLLEEIKKEHPSLFKYNGYDLFNAILKQRFWDFWYRYSARLMIRKLNEEHAYNITNTVILDKKSLDRFEFITCCSLFGKAFFSLHSSTVEPTTKKGSITGNIGLGIQFAKKSQNLTDMFGLLPDKIGEQNYFVFLDDYKERIKNDLALSAKNVWDLFRNLEWKQVQYLLTIRNSLIKAVKYYDAVGQRSPQALLLFEGENSGESHIIGQAARKYDFYLMNVNNGAKYRSAQDKGNNFHYWFMHNKSMQRSISEVADLDERQLPVAGHLSEDIAENYHDSGSLDEWKKQMKDKFIISLFTTTLFVDEQNDVLEYLEKLTEQNENICVLKRAHPSEYAVGDIKVGEKNDGSFITLQWFQDGQTQSLYDMLRHSDLCISFASTVALEASWFNVPSLTVEYIPASRLVFEDGKKIKHVNNIPELQKEVNDLLVDYGYNESTKYWKKQERHESVAEKIFAFLNCLPPPKSHRLQESSLNKHLCKS